MIIFVAKSLPIHDCFSLIMNVELLIKSYGYLYKITIILQVDYMTDSLKHAMPSSSDL